MSAPLTHEQCTGLVQRLATRDYEAALDYLDEQKAYPVPTVLFLGHFAASMVAMVLKKDPADADQFLSIQAPEGTEIPLYMQYVTTLVNDDDETAKALFSVMAQDETTLKREFAELTVMVADLLEAVARQKQANP